MTIRIYVRASTKEQDAERALVLEIIQGKTTVAEASRQFNLTSAELGSWVD